MWILDFVVLKQVSPESTLYGDGGKTCIEASEVLHEHGTWNMQPDIVLSL